MYFFSNLCFYNKFFCIKTIEGHHLSKLDRLFSFFILKYPLQNHQGVERENKNGKFIY